jgi:hypothetical protein
LSEEEEKKENPPLDDELTLGIHSQSSPPVIKKTQLGKASSHKDKTPTSSGKMTTG